MRDAHATTDGSACAACQSCAHCATKGDTNCAKFCAYVNGIKSRIPTAQEVDAALRHFEECPTIPQPGSQQYHGLMLAATIRRGHLR